jgi:hypothetical protein
LTIPASTAVAAEHDDRSEALRLLLSRGPQEVIAPPGSRGQQRSAHPIAVGRSWAERSA